MKTAREQHRARRFAPGQAVEYRGATGNRWHPGRYIFPHGGRTSGWHWVQDARTDAQYLVSTQRLRAVTEDADV